jgi:hypothetical protein
MIYIAYSFEVLGEPSVFSVVSIQKSSTKRRQQNQKVQGLPYYSVEVLKVTVKITARCVLTHKQFAPPKQTENLGYMSSITSEPLANVLLKIYKL